MDEWKEPETETVDADAAQTEFNRLLDDVSSRRTRVVVKRDGVAVAAVVSLHDLEQLRFLARKREEALAVLQQSWDAFKDVPEDELQREIDKALAEVRAEMAAEREAASRQ